MSDRQSDYRALLAQTQQTLANTQALYQAVTAVTSTLHHDEAIQRILEQLIRVIPHDSASIQLLRKGYLEVVAGHGWDDPASVVGIQFPIPGDNPNTIVVQKRQIYILNDAEDHYSIFRDNPLAMHIRSWIGVPMVVRDEVIGLMALDSSHRGYFTEDHAELLSAFVSPVAIAIENARLYEETKRQADEMSALYETSLEISRITELSESLQMICERATKLLSVSKGGLYLYNEKDQELELVVSYGLKHNFSGTRLKVGEGISGHIIQTGEALIVDHYSEWDNRANVYDSEVFTTVIGVPMKWHGRMLGTITLGAETQERKFTVNDVRLLELFANQAAIAIGNARLYEAERTQVHIAKTMQNVGKLLTSQLELSVVFERIFDLLAEVIDYDSVSIQLSSEDGVTSIVAARGFEDLDLAREIARTVTVEQISSRFANRKVAVISDVSTDSTWIRIAGLEHIQSWIGAALRVKEQMIGVLYVDSNTVNAFTADMGEMVEAFANQAAIAIENARLHEAAQREIDRRIRAESDLRIFNEELEQTIEARMAELAAANERLQELDEMKSRFISNVSHELRTPIANLQFRMELLQHDVESNREAHIGMLNQSLSHLEALIEDVLDLSRLERDKTEIKFSAVDLNIITRQVVDSQEPRAMAMGTQLLFKSKEDVPLVRGNHVYLLRVVSNLVINALNYTPAGTVTVQTYAHNGRVCFEIVDTGIGIRPEDRPYIFDRFFRGQDVNQSSISGTGLGLSIVKEIVEIHDGDIEIESEIGLGTTFRIWLPIADTP